MQDDVKSFDKYYTKAEVVDKCMSKFRNRLGRYDLVIEPAAGAGAFFNRIDHQNKIALDIKPGAKGIRKIDWLNYNVSNKYKRVLVIGNPPFGKYQRMAIAFIQHALSFSNVQTIAFILPDVFNKHTRQKILPKNWRIVSITGLEKNSFLIDGNDYHIPACFFIFDKSSGRDLREVTGLKAKDFRFGSKNDFDFFVFGSAPKNITKHPKSNNRGHYIKSNIPVKKLINRIRNMEWEGNSCASGGVYWLTKHEFIKQYINRYERRV